VVFCFWYYIDLFFIIFWASILQPKKTILLLKAI